VNAFITHREYAKSVREKPLSHADFLIQLHEELLALGDDDFLETVPTPVSTAYSLASSKHQLMVSTDKTAKGKFKFRVCKVCSVLRGAGSPGSNRPPGTTRHYCKQCSTDRGRLFLCSTARHVSDGNFVSCFNIWHSKWKNRDQLP
ncbi:hypothetical protein PHYSODRAFT_449908, partial [Phytophthora sojae]